MIWFLLLSLAGLIWYAATSDSPGAQQLQHWVNHSHTETVTPLVLVLKPGTFTYYKLDVPAGASQVTVDGSFSAAGAGDDDKVEVSLLSDAAYVDWQQGYGSSTYYASGRVTQGTVEAQLPAEPGTYYLVFNNKFSSKAAKTVQSTVSLHYRRGWQSF